MGYADGQLSYILGASQKNEQSSTAKSLSASYSSARESESVDVNYGRISVSSSANAPIIEPSGVQGAAAASGESYDNYTFTLPGGGAGIARFTFHLRGNFNGSRTGQGDFKNSYEAKVDMGVANQLFTGFRDGTPFFSGSEPWEHSTFTIDRPVSSGNPFYVDMALVNRTVATSTSAEATPPGDAQCDAAISLSIGGVSVFDEQNNPIEFSAESNTGSQRAANIPAGAPFNTVTLANNAPGRMGTVVSLLDGVASVARSVGVAFVAPPSPLNSQIKPASDVVELNGTGTDPVVVQLSFDLVAAKALFGSLRYVKLAWLDTEAGIWKNAILGNTGDNKPTFINRAYNPATDFHKGFWGQFENVVWAVVNHNSQFVVTDPPPFLVVNSVNWPTPNTLHLVCSGEPERALRVDASSDLKTWTPVTNVVPDVHGDYQFDDTAAAGANRFYRVVIP